MFGRVCLTLILDFWHEGRLLPWLGWYYRSRSNRYWILGQLAECSKSTVMHQRQYDTGTSRLISMLKNLFGQFVHRPNCFAWMNDPK